jgi:hypothetical protein
MYFADLTPYAYGREVPQPTILNVGWLSAEHPFLRGDANERFVSVLRRLIKSPVNLYRGSHICEFCPPPPVVRSPRGIDMPELSPETMGNGEIRVTGADDIIYVAPVLVLHYVTVHRYLPPQAFIDAVLNACSSRAR